MTGILFLPRKNVLLIAVGVLCLVLLLPYQSNAQNRHVLNNSPSFKIEAYDVLPDAGYSLGRVINDTSLRFKPDSLRPSVSNDYWVKLVIANPYPSDEPYVVQVSKSLNYTLYRYNTITKSWAGTAAGLNAASEFRVPGQMSLVLKKQTDNVFYFKISLRDIKRFNLITKPRILFFKQVVFAAEERFTSLFTLICCIVLASFSVYNLYIYFQLKDKAYLYYVMVQMGALFYLLSIGMFLNPLIGLRIYNLNAWPDGTVHFLNLNGVIMHASVTIVFCGFIQFTRSYLCTKDILPAYDKILKMLSFGYFLIEVVPVSVTILGWVYINNVPTSNVYILVMITACTVTAVVAHKKGAKAAKYFLAANLLPLIFTACTSVYILLYTSAGSVLPQLAILSQILTFAVALVARIKLVNGELQAKEIEAIRLENSITITEYKQRLMEEENKNITLTMQLEKDKNEQLQQKLDANQRELVGNSLYIYQKNKLLADLKMQMEGIGNLHPGTNDDAIKNIQSSLKEGAHLDDEWNKFKMHFEQVHPSFFSNLQAAHPNLTKYELRLYAYFHINLSTKEVGTLLNIAPASVRQAKARLNKKMGK